MLMILLIFSLAILAIMLTMFFCPVLFLLFAYALDEAFATPKARPVSAPSVSDRSE